MTATLVLLEGLNSGLEGKEDEGGVTAAGNNSIRMYEGVGAGGESGDKFVISFSPLCLFRIEIELWA